MTERECEHDRVIAQCSEVLEARPDDVDALGLRGWAWHEKKQYDNAIADFDAALSWDVQRLDILNNRGLAFSAKGEHDLAIADFTAAINRDPTHANLQDFYFNRGRSRNLNGAHQDAIQDLTEAIRLDPRYVKAYRVRASSWADLGDYHRSIADYSSVVRLVPDSSDDYHNRGNVWFALGKLRTAIADFTQAIHLDPINSETAKTHTSRGNAWNRKGRYAKALVDFERALELDSRSVKRRVDLAEFLATCPKSRFRDGARALELIAEACDLTDRIDVRHLDCLAAAHAAQGDFASAISFQKKALNLAPKDEDKEYMRLFIQSYAVGSPCWAQRPKWRERWA